MKLVFVDDLGDTPARVHRPTGTIFWSRKYNHLPLAQKKFILAHEMGHSELQTRNEFEADKYAFNALAGSEPKSLKSTMYAMMDVFKANNPEQRQRIIENLKRSLEFDYRVNKNQNALIAFKEMNNILNDTNMNTENNADISNFSEIQLQKALETLKQQSSKFSNYISSTSTTTRTLETVDGLSGTVTKPTISTSTALPEFAIEEAFPLRFGMEGALVESLRIKLGLSTNKYTDRLFGLFDSALKIKLSPIYYEVTAYDYVKIMGIELATYYLGTFSPTSLIAIQLKAAITKFAQQPDDTAAKLEAERLAAQAAAAAKAEADRLAAQAAAAAKAEADRLAAQAAAAAKAQADAQAAAAAKAQADAQAAAAAKAIADAQASGNAAALAKAEAEAKAAADAQALAAAQAAAAEKAKFAATNTNTTTDTTTTKKNTWLIVGLLVVGAAVAFYFWKRKNSK